MSSFAEYIKHTRHFDGLGMGDQDLEQRAAALEAERDRLRERVREMERLIQPWIDAGGVYHRHDGVDWPSASTCAVCRADLAEVERDRLRAIISETITVIDQPEPWEWAPAGPLRLHAQRLREALGDYVGGLPEGK